MKVYMFDPQNGLFEGEAFEDPKMLKHKDGITPIPPPDYEHGQVPVFDHQNNNWSVIPINIAKQLLNNSTAKSSESTV